MLCAKSGAEKITASCEVYRHTMMGGVSLVSRQIRPIAIQGNLTTLPGLYGGATRSDGAVTRIHASHFGTVSVGLLLWTLSHF